MISEKLDQYHWWDALKIAMPALTLVNKKDPFLHDAVQPYATQTKLQKSKVLGY